MLSILKQKQIALKKVGIKMTERSSISFFESLDNSISVIKDEQGSYNLSHLSFDVHEQGDVFAGEEKILSWKRSENNGLILDVFCLEQVNFWDSLSFSNIVINAKGPLFLGDKVTCTGSLFVKAQSVVFNQAIYCDQNLVTEAVNGIVFLDLVISNICSVNSFNIYQFEQVEIKAQTDFTCDTYWSSHETELASPIFRLQAERALISGQIYIDKECFIETNKLVLGCQGQKSKIFISGENHIKTDALSVLGMSQIMINAKVQSSIIQINSHLKIDSDANLKVNNASIHFNSAILKGKFRCTQSELSAKKIENTGKVLLDTIRLDVGHLAQSGQLAIESCEGMINRIQTQETALTIIKNSELHGEAFDDKGQLELEKAVFKYTDHFVVDVKTKANSKNATINTENFTIKGYWEYEKLLTINAGTALVDSHGALIGHVTKHDELFVKKEDDEQTKATESTDTMAVASVTSSQLTQAEHKSSYANNRFFSSNNNEQMKTQMEEKTQAIGHK